MRIVGILVVAHPELDGGLAQHLGDGIGNDESALVDGSDAIGSGLTCLQHNGIGGS